MLDKLMNNKYYNIARIGAYYLLVFSISVCTILRFINWQDNCEPWIVPFVINSLYALRKFFSMPVLLVTEVLYFIKVMIGKYDKKQLISAVIMSFLGIISLMATREIKTIYFISMIYFSKYADFKKILDVHIIGKFLILIVLIVGNIFEIVYIAPQRGNGFGMVHYNTLSQFLMFLMFALSCRFNRGNDKKVSFTLFSTVLAILCIYPIDSRTPVVILAMFVVLMWGEKFYNLIRPNIKKYIKFLFIVLPVLLTVMSWVLGILVVDYGLKIDHNLSARFVEYVYAYREMGIKFFSRSLTIGNGTGLYYFDNQYARLIFDSGFIYCLVVFTGFIVLNYKVVKRDSYMLMIVLLCLYIDGTSGGLFDNELIVVLMTFIFAGDSIISLK